MLVDSGSGELNEEAMVENSEITAGQLVLVATPLGNLGDISRRALELLESADVIYCEDTRRSSTLFSAHRIAVNGRLRALHETTKRRCVIRSSRRSRADRPSSSSATPARRALVIPGLGWPRRSPTLVSSSRPPRTVGGRGGAHDKWSIDRALRDGGLRAAKVGRTRSALRPVDARTPDDRLLRVAPAPRGHTE